MTPQQFIGIAVRIFAIWLVILGAEMVLIGTRFGSVYGDLIKSTFIPAYVIAFLCFVIAALLWFFPMAVAHRLLPRTRFENTLKIPLQETVVVACIILGIWIFATKALPALSYYTSLLIQAKIDNIPLAQSWWLHSGSLLTAIMSFVVSVILCFKAHSIAKYLTKKPVPRQEWLEEE